MTYKFLFAEGKPSVVMARRRFLTCAVWLRKVSGERSPGRQAIQLQDTFSQFLVNFWLQLVAK